MSTSSASPSKKMAYLIIHTLDLEYVPWYCEGMDQALRIFCALHDKYPELSGMLEIQTIS
jgi:hypothetical protein